MAVCLKPKIVHDIPEKEDNNLSVQKESIEKLVEELNKVSNLSAEKNKAINSSIDLLMKCYRKLDLLMYSKNLVGDVNSELYNSKDGILVVIKKVISSLNETK